MTKIVLADTDRLDLVSGFATTEVIKSASELEKNNVVYVLSETKESLEAIKDQDSDIYIPSYLLTEDYHGQEHIKVYFDLENYPFYHQAKHVIEQEEKPRGVFRYRRMVTKEIGSSMLLGDLYVLSNLLGGAEDIRIKQTDQTITPAHTIITVNFGGGTMAHIEYTIADRERIELEWSGVKNIIEFDSDEMSPIQPIDRTKLPLLYTVDSILNTAHSVDQNLLDEFKKIEELLNRGGN